MTVFKIPKNINELTFAQFQKIKDWDGIVYAELVEKLLGIDFDEALKLVDEEFEPKDFLFMNKLFDFKPEAPKTIMVGFKKIKVPGDLFKKATLGQIETTGIILKDFEFYEDKPENQTPIFNEVCKYAIQITAIFLYPLFFECKFNSKKYMNIEKLLNKCFYRDILNISFFLLMSFLKFAEMNKSALQPKILN